MARAPALQDIEELPEADRLEGYPHPRATRVLYGHEAVESRLAETFGSGRMHHGWLIAGREGIGKATLAYRLAAFLLADPSERDPFGASLLVDAETVASRQVKALSHPGLLVLRRPYDTKTKRFVASIPIDEVRKLRAFLARSADGGAWRVVIVDQADELNVNAANALLKSLEEPPPRTVFLLLSSEPGRLLATIRSRCRTLDLAPLAPDALRKAAAAAIEAAGREPLAEADWPALAHLAGGSVRRLLGLAAAGGLDLYKKMYAAVSGLPKVQWSDIHRLADECSGAGAEQKFELFYDLLLGLLARLARAEAMGQGTTEETALAARLAGNGRLASLAQLWETLVREKAEAQALNLDKKTLILETFVRLEALAR
jgi:DNA polymerase-3 subunit delta'